MKEKWENQSQGWAGIASSQNGAIREQILPEADPTPRTRTVPRGVLSRLSEAARNSEAVISRWKWDIQVLEMVIGTAENMEKEPFPPAKFPTGGSGLGAKNPRKNEYPGVLLPSPGGFRKQRENPNLLPSSFSTSSGHRLWPQGAKPISQRLQLNASHPSH